MTAMYRNCFIALALAALAAGLSGCSAQQELLNSDRIERRFGSYGVEVLSQNVAVRRTNLYSVEPDGPVCRTYAIVLRAATFSDQIAPIHERIVAGASIGSAFRESGWTVEKRTTHIGALRLQDASHPLAGLMQLDAPASLATHVYKLSVSKADDTHDYATIIETHHPDYLDEQELHVLFGNPDPLDDAQRMELYRLVLLEHWN